MALEYYGVDKAAVLAWLVRYSVAGNALPEYDEIDQAGTFLDTAAAEVQDAIMKGGHAAAAGNNSTTQPVAYGRLRGAVAERAALYFVEALGGLDTAALETKWERSNNKLEDFASGRRIGELTVSDGRTKAQFKHGSMSSDTLDTHRFSLADEL